MGRLIAKLVVVNLVKLHLTKFINSCNNCSPQAEKFEEHIGKNPVLALKGVKVSEFGGK